MTAEAVPREVGDIKKGQLGKVRRAAKAKGEETLDEGLPVLTPPRDEVIPLLPILFTYSKMIVFHILAQFVDDHGCLTMPASSESQSPVTLTLLTNFSHSSLRQYPRLVLNTTLFRFRAPRIHCRSRQQWIQINIYQTVLPCYPPPSLTWKDTRMVGLPVNRADVAIASSQSRRFHRTKQSESNINKGETNAPSSREDV
eukprot:scaffold6388_cov76-Alexandrium_tamarense.AAC.1